MNGSALKWLAGVVGTVVAGLVVAGIVAVFALSNNVAALEQAVIDLDERVGRLEDRLWPRLP